MPEPLDPQPGVGARLAFSPETERRLVWLMMARLGLSLVGFAIVLGLDGLGLGPALADPARQGLYWTLAFAFLVTALSAAALRRVRSPRGFAGLQLATDVVVVSLLVYFSGGHASVFSFLYVAVAAYGSLLFERRGALAAATACSVAYGAVLLADWHGLARGLLGDAPPIHGAVALATWGVHVGALFLVGALASVLAGEVRRTGAALDRSASDVLRLRNLNARIVQSLESGLLTTDAGGRIASFNPEAERITGVSAMAALGRHVDAVIPGAWESLADAAALGDPVRRQRLPFTDARGEQRFLGAAASLLRDDAGRVIGRIFIFQDVTQVVEMEGQLTRRERLAAVGEMAAKIAHEIRNPLAAISGSVQMLRGGAPATPAASPHGAEEDARLMGIVVREADRLSALITDFLGYARPRPAHCKAVRVDELVAEVTEVLRGGCPPDVALELDLPGRAAGAPRAGAAAEQTGAADACRVQADPDLLRQLLWNLCTNAVQAMPEGGRLRIAVRAQPQGCGAPGRSGEAATRAGGAVEICVEDTGVGIDPELRERLFEPFFTTKSHGTGLGLATVHRIVEAHGAQLEVDSEPGRGTRFRILMPVEGPNA